MAGLADSAPERKEFGGGDVDLLLLEEAHHVYKYIERDYPKANDLSAILKPVLDALEGSTPGVSTPGAAQMALEKLDKI